MSSAEPAAPPAWFDYLYIDANMNSASGGHAAVRIGAEVFHFQYDGGLLVLERDEWLDFQLAYRGLQNRNIHLTRVRVSGETFERLENAFRQRHLAGTRQLALVEAAGADARLAARLAGESNAEVLVPGLGFFSDPHAEPASSSTRLSSLLSAVEQAHGDGYLGERRAQLEEALAALSARPVAWAADDFAPGHFPKPHYSFHERYRDLVAALHALDVLERAPALRASSRLESASVPLADADAAQLEPAAADLADRLVRLAASSRPDWGPALLLGMARLEAIEASLERGHWLLLDPLPRDAARLDNRGRRRTLVAELEQQAEREWQDARAAWLADGADSESQFTRLEETLARWSELSLARAGAPSMRVHSGRMLPRGIARLATPPVPRSLAGDPAATVAALAQRAEAVTDAIAVEQRYDLIARNCVTELFATLDRALLEGREDGAGAAFLEAEEARRFGGVMPADAGLGSIPFVSAKRVRANWRVVEARELRSLRRVRLERLRSQHQGPWLALRESNTLTSTLYVPGPEDSLFLLFSDERLALRPVVGILNLLTAAAGTGLGLFTLPFDGGERFDAGMRGMLFSLPELAFQSIRKGTHDWIPPEHRRLLQD